MAKNPYLIVGLGNIGKEYEGTRHNTGFIFLDELLKNLAIKDDFREEPKFKASIQKIEEFGNSLILAKPSTFMNLSGEAVSKIINFYKIPLENLIVIYDDIDLPLGKIRIRENGSAGTHNGMKSIIECLGSEKFNRIRIGIESRGVSSPSQQDLSSFVLSPYKKDDLKTLSFAIKEAISGLKDILSKK